MVQAPPNVAPPAPVYLHVHPSMHATGVTTAANTTRVADPYISSDPLNTSRATNDEITITAGIMTGMTTIEADNMVTITTECRFPVTSARR
jgi:hypothetical protein